MAGLAQRYGLMIVVVAAIAYGSLYPFAFHDRGSLGADISHLAGTWMRPSQSRGDTLANLLLYMPFGLTIALALAPARFKFRTLILAAIGGALLSLGIELAQFFDAGRVSTLSDFYLNVAGTLAGAALAGTAGAGWAKASWPSGSAPAFARLLLLAWIGWRLYPYVPTIDLHKYWHSVRPLLTPHAGAYDILRYAVYWWSAIFLFQIALGSKRMPFVFPAMLCFFAAKIVIIGQVITLPELLGAALALLLGQFVLKRHAVIGVAFLAALLLLTIILSRVLPWQIGTAQKAFQWIPFFSVLHGSLQVNAISFAEKFYLYGTALLLLVAAGMRLTTALALECAILITTSVLQTFMVGRSAEITDTVLALLVGLIYALLRRQYPDSRRTAS
ncbi:MAG: VanZ family protein [Rhizomicrobium sp.]